VNIFEIKLVLTFISIGDYQSIEGERFIYISHGFNSESIKMS